MDEVMFKSLIRFAFSHVRQLHCLLSNDVDVSLHVMVNLEKKKQISLDLNIVGNFLDNVTHTM